MAARMMLIVVAALTGGGCNMADNRGKTERTSAATAPRQEPPAATAPKPGPKPARSRLDELDGAPQAAAPAKPGDVTRAWFAGSWTDSGDCADAGRFEPNGTYRLADGTRGMWNVQDGRLVVQHAGGRSALRLRRVDQKTVEVLNEDGSIGRSTRC